MLIEEHVTAVKRQTGKTPEDLSILAKAQNLVTHNEITDWLKTKFELTHGHATTITHLILKTATQESADNRALAARFSGVEADWIPACKELFSKIERFGSAVSIELQAEPITFKRESVIFGILVVNKGNLEIGVNVPNEPFDSTYTDASGWSDLVTHKVSIIVQQQINDDLINWLRRAYDSVV